MRMWHYWLVGAALLVPSLFAALLSGIVLDSGEGHFWAGLFASCLGVGVHTLTILFMLVTGRVLREAMRARPLGPEFLLELNQFFARKSAYPLATLAAFSLVATGVLGYSARGFGISPAWHVAVGVLTLVFNLWALGEEYRALRVNQALIDRAANVLDRLDREHPPVQGALDDAQDPHHKLKLALSLAIGAWFPYLYWAVIVWRGDFARVSVHPWLELSLIGWIWSAVAWRARQHAGKSNA